MIYGRAFPGRDRKISQEDMVSKFLEALLDDGQRTALEYPKVPETLDAALRQSIHYREAARKTNDIDDGFTRAYRTQSADMEADNTGYSQLQEIVRAVGRGMSQSKAQEAPQKQTSTSSMATEPTATSSGTKESNEKGGEPKFSLADVQQLLSHAMANNQSKGNEGKGDSAKTSEPQDKDNTKRGKNTLECGYCSKIGHKTAECRTRIRDFKQKFTKKAKAEKSCFECLDKTHLQRDCPYYKARMETGSRRSVTEMVQQFLTSQVSANNPPLVLALPSGLSATSAVDSGNQNNAGTNTQNNQGTVREATTQDAGTTQK